MPVRGWPHASRAGATRSGSSPRVTLRLVDTPLLLTGSGQGLPGREPPTDEEAEQAARKLTVLRELEETGALWCPLRTARIARDRCVETQHRTRCGKACWRGPIARSARAEDLLSDAREDERARKARALQGTSPPKRDPWRIVCGYRGCGREFERARAFSRKPIYCCARHREMEAEARQSDRRFGRRSPI